MSPALDREPPARRHRLRPGDRGHGRDRTRLTLVGVERTHVGDLRPQTVVVRDPQQVRITQKTAGAVEVDVSIDKAGQHERPVEVDDARVRADERIHCILILRHSGYPVPLDDDRRGPGRGLLGTLLPILPGLLLMWGAGLVA